MSRTITVAAAQSGPIQCSESRADVVGRRIDQLRQAHSFGCQFVVFTECALTPFFPHWWVDPEEEREKINCYCEREMPNSVVQPLFDEAKRLGLAFQLGYAELAEESGSLTRYNSSVLVDSNSQIVGHYRKIHLPGHSDHRPNNPYQNLEKRYFAIGNKPLRTWKMLNTTLGMCICNDRRWPETYRVLGLRGVELIGLGYNTPDDNPEYPQTNHLTLFHNSLSLQAGAYQNGTWVVAAAKAGEEEGVRQIGQSAIVAPSGEVVAMASTQQDELVVYCCDLELNRIYKEGIFNFSVNRRIEHYGLITKTRGVIEDS